MGFPALGGWGQISARLSRIQDWSRQRSSLDRHQNARRTPEGCWRSRLGGRRSSLDRWIADRRLGGKRKSSRFVPPDNHSRVNLPCWPQRQERTNSKTLKTRNSNNQTNHFVPLRGLTPETLTQKPCRWEERRQRNEREHQELWNEEYRGVWGKLPGAVPRSFGEIHSTAAQVTLRLDSSVMQSEKPFLPHTE